MYLKANKIFNYPKLCKCAIKYDVCYDHKTSKKNIHKINLFICDWLYKKDKREDIAKHINQNITTYFADSF